MHRFNSFRQHGIRIVFMTLLWHICQDNGIIEWVLFL